MTTQDEIPVHESTRKRRRWGCTCGCLALIVLLLFGVVGLTAWMVRPVRPNPYAAWLDPSIDGFGLLSLDSDDEGMGELTNFILKRISARIRQQVPESERKAVAAGTTVARKSFDRFVHPQVVFLLNSGEGDDSALAAVQLRNRLAILLAGLYLNERLPNASAVATTDTALALYQLSGSENDTSPTLVALTGRTLIVSDSAAMISRATDRIAGRNSAGEASEDLQHYISPLALDQPAPGRDLAFAAVTPPGRLMGWLADLEKALSAEGLTENLQSALTARKVSLDDVKGITLTGDVTSADKISFTATLYGSRMDAAKRLSEGLRLSLNQIMARVEGAAATGGLSTRVDVKPLGTSVIVGLQVSGLQKLIERWIPVPPSAPAEETAPAPETAAPAKPAAVGEDTPPSAG